MDEERLAEIDRQIEALGQPQTPADAILAELGALSLDEADAILDELAEGQDIDVELAPLPRVTTSVSEPPTGVSAAPPMADAGPGETDEFPMVSLDDAGEPAFEEPVFEEPVFGEPEIDEPEFDLPPPSQAPDAEDLLGSGLEDLGKSDVPEPLSASMAAWIDPPDSEIPSDAPSAPADIPPNPKLPELGEFDEDEGERTGLFTQEDIEAIRASQPPPPRSAPPPASQSIVPSVPPPPPDGPRRPPSAPPPPIPVSVAPPASDEELEILDDDDFELMIEEDGLDAVDDAMDDVIDELIDDSIKEPVASFDDATEASEADAEDEPVIREPEVSEAEASEASEASEDEGEEGEDGEKKGFFKKLFG